MENDIYLTDDDLDYVNSLKPEKYKWDLLNQIRLRNLMSKDRDEFERKYNNAVKLLKYGRK